MTKETYISVDVEASGPIPGEYSMLSIGACVVGNTSKRFYVELKPLNNNYVREALKVCGLPFDELKIKGKDPQFAMDEFSEWVERVSRGSRAVFCSWSTFDWMFVKWYLVKFGHERLFGPSGCEMKSYYTGMLNIEFGRAVKRYLLKELKPEKKHSHNALDDAIEQAEMFSNMFAFNSRKNG